MMRHRRGIEKQFMSSFVSRTAADVTRACEEVLRGRGTEHVQRVIEELLLDVALVCVGRLELVECLYAFR